MDINKFTLLTIFSVIYVITLIIIYYSKERLKTKETTIYKAILFANLFGLICQTLCRIVSDTYDNINTFLANFILKSFLLYFILFGALLLVYIVAISSSGNTNKTVKKIAIVYGILGAVVYIMPISLHINIEKDIGYSYGMAVNYSYVVGGITSILLIVMLIKEMKIVSKKKLLPLLLYLIFSGLAILIQRLNPEFMLICYVETFLCFVMYFTIENPDIKMLNELYKNKELMEQNYEDKYNFLFEMTQEARNPLVNINSLSTALRLEEDPDKVKEGLLTLNNMVRQLDFSINNILNISSLDVQKIKIINSKYDLGKLCEEIATRIKPEIKKDVHFELGLPKQVPTLYGDYMKLRQILYSLLINSCKNTETGNIYFKVNVIEKYDICRVVFNISDTGSGMSIEKINDILSSTGELEKSELDNLEKKEFNVKVCQKVMKIMGGNLMIKSNVGEGTDVVLTIDQRVHHERENSVLTQYENDIANYRKVLVVCQDKSIINSIKRKLNSNGITSSVLYYGMDAVDKIKSGKEYDFILIEDEMKEMTGFMTFKEMQKVKGFRAPVIIMLKKDKDNIKDHFLEDGFKDYLLINNIDSELDRIIEKY